MFILKRPALLVSSPHPTSHIRHIKLASSNVDEKDRIYISFRQSLLQRHHKYWEEHNRKFEVEKHEFIASERLLMQDMERTQI
jgi:hypothetical protein